MFDLISEYPASIDSNKDIFEKSWRKNPIFRIAKFGFDVAVCLILLPIAVVVALVLSIINPWLNPGPLFYTQLRMGKGCKPFIAYKFRSMLPVGRIDRTASAPIEEDRIMPLGRFLRRSRLDELPQILNVLKCEMSLIGPRPDYLPHAEEFLLSVPGYRERHVVRPGISGLAQTEIGYAVGPLETRRKVAADLFYIRRSSLRMEAWIVWRTLRTVLGLRGA